MYIKNQQNSIIGALALVLNKFTVLISDKFSSDSYSASVVFYVLVGAYLIFVFCQTVSGYFLLKAASRSEVLFLAIMPKDCRELERNCASFMSASHVPFLEPKLTSRTKRNSTRTRSRPELTLMR